jgi:hypothetical protein
LFWRDELAEADGVLYDLVFSRSNVQARIIARVFASGGVQLDVVGTIAESGITAGSQGCRALISVDEHCGSVTGINRTIGGNTTDPFTGDEVFKAVRHLYCFDEGQGQDGDSGAPAYRRVADGARAMGIHSARTQSGDCFSASSRIAAETGTHVWQGE